MSRDAVREMVERAKPHVAQGPDDERPLRAERGRAKQGREFHLLSAGDVGAMPSMSWLAKGVLPKSGIGAVFGKSGVGKTFVVGDLVGVAGDGGSWFGYSIPKGQRCVYVALEGQAGVPSRIKAWERFRERPFPDSVRFVFDDFRLTERDDLLGLAAAIDAGGGADLIVIDTLNRTAPGLDENASSDMGRVIEALRQLQALTGGLVIVVHHSGKNAMAGMRGHSSLFAALDASIEVSRTDDGREITIAKVKDGEDGARHRFRLVAVEVGVDDDGEPITSCAVEPEDEEDRSAPRPKQPKGGNQKVVLDALRPLFRASHDFGKAGAPAVRPCIEIEAAVADVAPRLVVEPKRRRERALQAITGLVASGVLASNEGWIWLA